MATEKRFLVETLMENNFIQSLSLLSFPLIVSTFLPVFISCLKIRSVHKIVITSRYYSMFQLLKLLDILDGALLRDTDGCGMSFRIVTRLLSNIDSGRAIRVRINQVQPSEKQIVIPGPQGTFTQNKSVNKSEFFNRCVVSQFS